MHVIKNDGSQEPFDLSKIQKATSFACAGLDVSQSELEVNVHAKFFPGIRTSDIQNALITSAGELISRERPQFKFAAARLLLQKVYKEVTGGPVEYPHLRAYVLTGIEEKQLNPMLADFDLDALNAVIDKSRDLKFDYLGLQTLADRYLIREADKPGTKPRIIELPQHFFMRVAMGLAIRDAVVAGADIGSLHIAQDAINFYNLLSSFDYMASTPTLFNAGTLHSQLSSCYLNTVADALYSDEDGIGRYASIYGTIEECARLSKYAGGIGTDWTRVRPEGSIIKGTNGKSAGVVPYMKVWNDTAIAVNQGGKRNGAFAGYMEPWHPDFLAFCDLKKNSGDERRRAHEIFPAAWVPDLLMERAEARGVWSFFAPDEYPELHELWGDAFKARYEQLEAEGKFRAQMPAIELWRKMITSLFETGHPWITFKDECNRRSPQQHAGVIHCSNLCTEITLNTSDDETAVCNLGSVNLANHVTPDGKIDHAKLGRTISVAMRMLDNVVDINFYPSERARNSNLRHRPVGLGMMGLADMLAQMKVDVESQEYLEVNDELAEAFSYHAIMASNALAYERGSYASFDGSLWSKGILPIDTARKDACDLTSRSYQYDWETLRGMVKLGMRNSNCMAIAPTATIANITGVVPSIESPFELEYTKTNLAGTFIVASSALDYGFPVKEAFAVDQTWAVKGAAVRGKWIDQSQSLNKFVPANIKGKELSALYMLAWKLGLKTTYYLRRQVVDVEDRVAQADAATLTPVDLCSISDPDCESCQ